MTRSPLKFFGGKSYHADWIISHFPEHVHYVEPFFGGGSVLFSKSENMVEGHSEAVNDIDRRLTNFFCVLQDGSSRKEMMDRLEFLPLSEIEFNAARYRLSHTVPVNVPSVDHAVDFFVVNRQSRMGMGKDFATLSRTRTRRGMNEQVSSWQSAITDLAGFAQRLSRVAILNRDFRRVIESESTPDTLLYLDPPYLPETRVAGGYAYEMTDQDHVEMLEMLSHIDGKFVLSGYSSELYETWASENGFKAYAKETTASSGSGKTKGKRTEMIWTNS